MGTRVSKTAIGAFVIGAVALLVAAVLVLGAGKLFTTEHTFITYFDGTVKGLNVGSPVMFRGVKVGEVTEITIIADMASHKLKIPVVFKLEPAKFRGTRNEFQRDPRAVEVAVRELGLRTQLQSMSFVTGQLMISLDFFPDKPAQFIGLNKELPEIPSIPTPLEQLQKTLENLPFKEIVKNLNETIQNFNRLVSSIDGKKTTNAIEATLGDLRTVVQHVNAKIDPLMESITRTSATAETALSRSSGAAEAALNEARETMTVARGEMKELVTTTKSTLETAQTALRQSEVTLQAYSDDSRLMVELNRTLRELSATTRSLRALSDYLERHPESLLSGKAAPKGD